MHVRKRGKRIAAGITAVALAAGGLSMGLLDASANLPGSTFESADGNIVVTTPGNTDWVNAPNRVIGSDAATGTGDNSFVQGSKENDINVSIERGSIPNSKADLGRFGVSTETLANGHVMMYLAWTRNNLSGTTNFDFELNQKPQPDMSPPPVGAGAKAVTLVRTGDAAANGGAGGSLVDDILINYDIEGGAQNPDLSIRRWTGTAWSAAVPLGSNVAEGLISTAIITPSIFNTVNLPIAAFGEAGIDMTEAGIIQNQNDPNAPCAAFGSAYVKSRASSAFASQMKDFIAPVPLSLDNCGTIIIKKVTDPTPDETDSTFGFNLSGGPSALDKDFDLKDGESETTGSVKAGSGYVAEEVTVPVGWTFDEATCDDDDSTVEDIHVDAGETVTCTFFNEGRGSLTVVKEAERDGVDFQFTADAPLDPATFALANGENQQYLNLAAGTYGVGETVPDGWNLDSATCDDGSDPATVEISPGEDVTCTFVNVIERGAVLVHKTAKHAASETGRIPQSGVVFTVENAQAGVNEEITTDGTGYACIDGLPSSTLDGAYTVTEHVPDDYASEDDVQNFVVEEGDCDTIALTSAVEFSNIPLTTVNFGVDSQVDGGTASVLQCTDADGNVYDETTDALGDGSISIPDLKPTDPAVTVTCTVVIDP